MNFDNFKYYLYLILHEILHTRNNVYLDKNFVPKLFDCEPFECDRFEINSIFVP